MRPSSSPALQRAYLLFIAALIGIGCWLAPIDAPARTQINDGLKRALTTFAAARALGAVVSVAQGTQVAATPGGVGVNFAPGEALKPLNELIEQFAAIMLAASVSFGIQLILLKVGAHWVMSALVCGVAAVWVAWRWQRGTSPRWLQSALIGLLLVRFAVPLSALANEQVYAAFMAEDYQAALTGIQNAPDTVTRSVPEPVVKGDTWRERLELWWKSLPSPKAAYEEVIKAASDWADRIVRLIAVFVLQTIVVPLGLLLAGWWMARAAVRSPLREIAATAA